MIYAAQYSIPWRGSEISFGEKNKKSWDGPKTYLWSKKNRYFLINLPHLAGTTKFFDHQKVDSPGRLVNSWQYLELPMETYFFGQLWYIFQSMYTLYEIH